MNYINKARKIATWDQAAANMLQRIGVDLRNHLALGEPWGRAIHSMVQSWRIRNSQPQRLPKSIKRKEPETWMEATRRMKASLDVRESAGEQGNMGVLVKAPASRLESIQPKAFAELNTAKMTRITHQTIRDLVDSQSRRCALTGRNLRPDTVALDHIIPVSRGGAHCIENAQLLHKEVNRAKGTLTNEEFIQLCRAVVSHMDQIALKPSSRHRKRSSTTVRANRPQETLFEI